MEPNLSAIKTKVFSSKEERAADQFKQKYIATGKFNLESFDDEVALNKILKDAKTRIGYTGDSFDVVISELKKIYNEDLLKLAEEKKNKSLLDEENLKQQEKALEEETARIRAEDKRKIEEEKAELRAQLAEIYKVNTARDLEIKQKNSTPVVPVDPVKPLLAWQILLQKKIKKPKVEKAPEPEPVREHFKTSIPLYHEVLDENITNIAKFNVDHEEKEDQIKFILKNKEAIKVLFEKSEKILKADINPEEYIKGGIFSENEVRIHNADVKEMEELYSKKNSQEEKEMKKIATIFEAMIINVVNLSKCLGENVIARSAFPVDDIFAPKIDAYVALQKLFLGFDMTMSNIEGAHFIEKIEKNLRAIKNGNPNRMKYAKDADGNLSTNEFIPKVIISGEISLVKEVMYDFNTLSEDEFSEKIKDHKMSREIVLQVIAQCRIFGNFARENDQNETAQHYENFVDAIYKIAEKSPVLKKIIGNAGFDHVSERIQQIVDEFKLKEIKKQQALEEFRASQKVA
ncbi:MAG: hypothetical protein NTZ44_00425 [Candidatus Nomurabacteria bacterium]|nr:hypothetical protein [Candidatus Nomurabacteria bacterium]